MSRIGKRSTTASRGVASILEANYWDAFEKVEISKETKEAYSSDVSILSNTISDTLSAKFKSAFEGTEYAGFFDPHIKNTLDTNKDLFPRDMEIVLVLNKTPIRIIEGGKIANLRDVEYTSVLHQGLLSQLNHLKEVMEVNHPEREFEQGAYLGSVYCFYSNVLLINKKWFRIRILPVLYHIGGTYDLIPTNGTQLISLDMVMSPEEMEKFRSGYIVMLKFVKIVVQMWNSTFGTDESRYFETRVIDNVYFRYVNSIQDIKNGWKEVSFATIFQNFVVFFKNDITNTLLDITGKGTLSTIAAMKPEDVKNLVDYLEATVQTVNQDMRGSQQWLQSASRGCEHMILSV